MYTATGRLAAQTPYLRIFEDNIDINDASGRHLASARRLGEWDPVSKGCIGPRRWLLQYASPAPPGPFANVTEQWALAALLTIASVRDASRRPSGLLSYSWCEIRKGALYSLCALCVAAAIFVALAVFTAEALEPLRVLLYDLEQRLCPRRMKLSSKYDGG